MVLTLGVNTSPKSTSRSVHQVYRKFLPYSYTPVPGRNSYWIGSKIEDR